MLTHIDLYNKLCSGQSIVEDELVFMDNIEAFQLALHNILIEQKFTTETEGLIIDLIFRDLNKVHAHNKNHLQMISIGRFFSDFIHQHPDNDWTTIITHLSSPSENYLYLHSLYKYGTVFPKARDVQSNIHMIRNVLDNRCNHDNFDWSTPSAIENLRLGYLDICRGIENEHQVPLFNAVICMSSLNIKSPDIWKTLTHTDQMNMVRLDYYNYKILCNKELFSYYAPYRKLLQLPFMNSEDFKLDLIQPYMRNIYKDIISDSFFIQLQLHKELFNITDLDLNTLLNIYESSLLHIEPHPLPDLY